MIDWLSRIPLRGPIMASSTGRKWVEVREGIIDRSQSQRVLTRYSVGVSETWNQEL